MRSTPYSLLSSQTGHRKWLSISVLTAVLAVGSAGCSDSTMNKAPAQASGDAVTEDSAINLGDTKTDSKSDVKDTASGDVAPVGCTGDSECVGKVSDLAICQMAVCNVTTGVCEAGLAADGASCDDGNQCWSERTCSSGKCGGGKPKGCDDNNACTDNLCDKATGCVATPNQAPCDDGDSCTAVDECKNGSCQAGLNNVCGCQNDAACADQDDGNFCNGTLYCDKGEKPAKCKVNPATVVSCPTVDDSYCLVTECNPKVGKCQKVFAHQLQSCNDQNSCTTG